MQFSSEVLKAIREATEKHGSNIPEAVAAALKALRELRPKSLYEEWLAGVEYQALQTKIYEFRHRSCQAMRKKTGFYASTPKVRVGSSPDIREIHRTLYDYPIDGVVLGDIKGSELVAIADGEEERAVGHQFNADLCRRLAERVRGDQTVRKVVGLNELKAIFDDLGGPGEEEEA